MNIQELKGKTSEQLIDEAEKLSIENGKLNYQVTLDSLVLTETISINRQFLKQ